MNTGIYLWKGICLGEKQSKGKGGSMSVILAPSVLTPV